MVMSPTVKPRAGGTSIVSRSIIPGTPRTMRTQSERPASSGPLHPDVSMWSMYRPTGFGRVINAPARARAFTEEPMVGSLLRSGPPYRLQQIRGSARTTGSPATLQRRTVESAPSWISAVREFGGAHKWAIPCVVFHLLYMLYPPLTAKGGWPAPLDMVSWQIKSPI